MAHYIDGFVLPVPRDRLNEYKRVVEAVAEIWKEHGAVDYWEYVGDDFLGRYTHNCQSGDVMYLLFAILTLSLAQDDASPQKALDERLIVAVHDGDTKMILELLQSGADPNARGEYDLTALT